MELVSKREARENRILNMTAKTSMEVLMSLPSPEEILRRAVEAKAKGAAALQKQAQAGTVQP